MVKNKDGGPAFPATYDYIDSGMSLRDWFAGMALQGFITKGLSDEVIKERPVTSYEQACQLFAIHAYGVADAMITEREKRNNNG